MHQPKGMFVPGPSAKSDDVVLVAVQDLKLICYTIIQARPVHSADFGIAVINVTKNHNMSANQQLLQCVSLKIDLECHHKRKCSYMRIPSRFCLRQR